MATLTTAQLTEKVAELEARISALEPKQSIKKAPPKPAEPLTDEQLKAKAKSEFEKYEGLKIVYGGNFRIFGNKLQAEKSLTGSSDRTEVLEIKRADVLEEEAS